MTQDWTKIWTDKAAASLVGKTIKEVRYLTAKERATLGWSMRPLVLILDDGTHIWPSSDDEGNNAGTLYSTDPALTTIPCIP